MGCRTRTPTPEITCGLAGLSVPPALGCGLFLQSILSVGVGFRPQNPIPTAPWGKGRISWH